MQLSLYYLQDFMSLQYLKLYR